MSFREWFIDRIEQALDPEETIPYRRLNWLFIPAASIVGGAVFTMSGNWWYAIQADVSFFGLLWLLMLPAKWVTELLLRTALRVVV